VPRTVRGRRAPNRDGIHLRRLHLHRDAWVTSIGESTFASMYVCLVCATATYANGIYRARLERRAGTFRQRSYFLYESFVRSYDLAGAQADHNRSLAFSRLIIIHRTKVVFCVAENEMCSVRKPEESVDF